MSVTGHCLLPGTYWFNYHLVVSSLENKAACLTGAPSERALLSPVCAGSRYILPVWPQSYCKYLQNKATFRSPQAAQNNKHSPVSPVVSDWSSAFVKAVTGESPIRGLRPPRGLTFGSGIQATSCQVLPCALKSLAALLCVTLGL